MHVLIIGGTGFIGPDLVRMLTAGDHQVTLFHRGSKSPDKPQHTGAVRHIYGERKDLPAFQRMFGGLKADVALDMFPFRVADARAFMNAMRGQVPRVVALSSIDVYLAYGRLHGTEPGPPQEVPLEENAALRETKQPHGDAYDKIGVEQIVMHDPELPATVLRLPAIHGPRDGQHRLYPYLKRMDDMRPAIMVDSRKARWRFSRAYVENVAAAIVLTLIKEQAAKRIYNVAEPKALSEVEWIQAIGRAANWRGLVEVLEPESMPAHLVDDFNWSQDWVVDSTRIRKELGYSEVIPRELALKRAIAWEYKNPPGTIDAKQFDYAAEDAAREASRVPAREQANQLEGEKQG